MKEGSATTGQHRSKFKEINHIKVLFSSTLKYFGGILLITYNLYPNYKSLKIFIEVTG